MTTIVGGAVRYDIRAPKKKDEEMSELKPKRVVIVDDSPAFCDLWSNFMTERYAETAHVETYSHPYDALPKIDDTIDLLIVDLEMPGMDGKKFVDYARAKGVSRAPHRGHLIALRRRAPRRFRIGETIAVINKTEARQQEAFLMILDSVMRR